MDFLPLNIEAKGIIEDFFFAQRIEASDMLFGNLFIWHFSRQIAYCVAHDCLIIRTTYPNEAPFLFFPLGRGDKKAALSTAREYFLDQKIPFSFHSLENAQNAALEALFPQKFSFTKMRDRFDYIYDIAELVALNGRKFHNKKNHLNKFLNLYPNFAYERVNPANAAEVLATYRAWFGENPSPSEGLKNEFKGIEASLQNFENLGMKGALIRIEGKIAAFSLAEQINEDSVVIHIEKANTFYEGIYQAINQQFLAREWAHLRFVNREEDLGLAGLRQAKMTYQPVGFVEKSNAAWVEN